MIPWRASTRMTAKSAVDAPVTMFRVYWICPGVSAMMNLRLGVAKYLYATSIVIPCSRSARRPSVRSARFTSSLPLLRDASSTASSWSSNIDLESYRSLPINVLFPSSTLPAVVKRSNCIFRYPFVFCVSILFYVSVNHRTISADPSDRQSGPTALCPKNSPLSFCLPSRFQNVCHQPCRRAR